MDIFYFYSTRESTPSYQDNVLKKASGKHNIIFREFINNGTHSLTQAYNIGLSEASCDIIVFAHDDIILSKNWDDFLVEDINNTEYGIIGVAGTTNISERGIWWENRQNLSGIVDHQKQDNGKIKKWSSRFSVEKPYVMDVKVVDGVFFAVHKKRIKTGFNEDFSGFHFYDLSFCMENFIQGVKIGVTTSFRVTHKSIGELNTKWDANRKKFIQLYGEHLKCGMDCADFIFSTIKNGEAKIRCDERVAIIIPTKNKMDYVIKCIESIKKHNCIKPTIYLADTGSNEEQKEFFKQYMKISPTNINFIEYDYYNFAKINNDVVKKHLNSEEYIIFCNNDIELLNNTIDQMVSIASRNKSSVGTVGCRLLYPNGLVQHGGIAFGVNKVGGYFATHFGLKSWYGASEKIERDVVGCTGALLLIQSKLFNQIGGFDENTTECFEDVILNFDCIIRNRVNFYLGTAVAVHHESLTRNEDEKQSERIMYDFLNVLMPKFNKHKNKLEKYVFKS